MPRQSRAPAQETDREIRRATSIEPTAIQEEYCAVPSDLYRFASLVSERDELLDHAEQQLKSYEARRAVEIVEAVPVDEKPPGEAKIVAQIRKEKGWGEAVREVSRARRAKADAFAVLEAIRAKKEMLISLGATQRLELEREALIRDRERSGSRRA